jgi:hypothetical protein
MKRMLYIPPFYERGARGDLEYLIPRKQCITKEEFSIHEEINSGKKSDFAWKENAAGSKRLSRRCFW